MLTWQVVQVVPSAEIPFLQQLKFINRNQIHTWRACIITYTGHLNGTHPRSALRALTQVPGAPPRGYGRFGCPHTVSLDTGGTRTSVLLVGCVRGQTKPLMINDGCWTLAVHSV